MKKFLSTVTLLLLLLLSLVWMLTACAEKQDLFASTAFESLTVNQKGNLVATVTLDLETVQSHQGEKAFLYELFPGEDVTALYRRFSIASASIGSKMQFEFPLMDNEHNRLYSTFAVCYADGHLLTTTLRGVDNPEALATVDAPFLWGENPKGLALQNAAGALDLNVAHAMIDADFASLISLADTTFSFSGVEYPICAAVLNDLDRQVSEAYACGMQVSLRLFPEKGMNLKENAALLHFLAERYSNGEFGIVTAYFVDASTLSAKDATRFTTLAYKALRSHLKYAQLYIISDEGTVSDAAAYFAELGIRLKEAMPTMAWGAAMIPADSENAIWEESDFEILTAKNIPALFELLRHQEGAPRRFAVCDVKFSAKNEQRQAVSFAYTYAKAMEAEANLIFYGAQVNDNVGLYSAKGEERALAEWFASIDEGLNQQQILTCKSLASNIWEVVSKLTPTRLELTGIGTLGAGSGSASAVFDFGSGETYGFTALGGVTKPQSNYSEALNSPTLYTWLEGTERHKGIQSIMKDGQALAGAFSLSVHTLSQYTASEQYTLTLFLEGVTPQGKAVSYRAQTNAPAASWQTVTFQIASFVAEIDLSQPCSLRLLTEADDENDEKFVFWVKSISANQASVDYKSFLPIVLSVGGVAVGFGVFFLGYCLLSRRRRR